MDDDTKDRVHLMTWNIPNARVHAANDLREGRDDNVILCLDIRDAAALAIAKASNPKEDYAKILARFARAEMIPTVWTTAPRSVLLRDFEVIKDRADHGNFWFVVVAAGGRSAAQVSRV